MLGTLMRSPVSSAKRSARRAAVHIENGRSSARGRRPFPTRPFFRGGRPWLLRLALIGYEALSEFR